MSSKNGNVSNNEEYESIEFLVNITPDAKYGLGLRLGMKYKDVDSRYTNNNIIVVESFKRNPVSNQMLPGELGIIRIGDEIISVNNERLSGYTIDVALSIVRDVVVRSRGSPVVFHIKRYTLKNISTTRIGSLQEQDMETRGTTTGSTAGSSGSSDIDSPESRDALKYLNKMHSLMYESPELNVYEYIMYHQQSTNSNVNHSEHRGGTKTGCGPDLGSEENKILEYMLTSNTNTVKNDHDKDAQYHYKCNTKGGMHKHKTQHRVGVGVGIGIGCQMQFAKTKIGEDIHNSNGNNNGNSNSISGVSQMEVPDWHVLYLSNLLLNPTPRDIYSNGGEGSLRTHSFSQTQSISPTPSAGASPNSHRFEYTRICTLLCVLLNNIEESNCSDKNYSVHASPIAHCISKYKPFETLNSHNSDNSDVSSRIRKLAGFFTDLMNYYLHSSYTNTIHHSSSSTGSSGSSDNLASGVTSTGSGSSSSSSILPLSLTAMPCGTLYNIDDIAVFACIAKRMEVHCASVTDSNSMRDSVGMVSVEGQGKGKGLDKWGEQCMSLMLCVDSINSYRISPDDTDTLPTPFQPRTVLPAASVACAMLADKPTQLILYNELVVNSCLSSDDNTTSAGAGTGPGSGPGSGLYFGELWRGRMEAGVDAVGETDIFGVINDSRLALWMHDLTPLYKLIETQSIKQFRVHRDSLKVSL